MASPARMFLGTGRTFNGVGRTVLLLACFALAGCGSQAGDGSTARANDVKLLSPGRATTHLSPLSATACAPLVLDTLGRIALRVYREGVASERTGTALHLVTTSIPLREAVQHDDPQAALLAARALVDTGHMTNLRVLRDTRTLADVGPSAALAPLHGVIAGTAGAPIGTFLTSVWADQGFLAEIDGITEGTGLLRAGEEGVPGFPSLPRGPLPTSGTLTEKGVDYGYASFPATAYPSGQVRVYVLRAIPSLAGLCARAPENTLVNTLTRIATLIYDGEAGRRTHAQIGRVQRDTSLLQAVANHDPTATRVAVERLLHQHIVRLRVSDTTHLLADVGGPFVLAPVRAPLRLAGHTIGSILLSIQDDEGYKRLVGRLAGLDVLMHMGARLVKSSLGPSAPPAPTRGVYRYRGKTFRVFTLDASAFPSGRLRISVLIPIPYV